jgi:enoyl-CoA hydratase
MAASLIVDRARPDVAIITFNRPTSLNSMSTGLVHDLRAVLAELGTDPEVRVVILTGAGRGFSSGHALGELESGTGGGWDLTGTMENQRLFSDLVLAINELPQVVIAAVNGPAAGGGLAMALAADTRVCSKSARFNAAFVRLGVSGCDVGVSYLLPRIVGPTLAFEMMLTGRLIDADEALRSGLVLRIVPDGEVLAAALEVADRIVMNSPFGVRMTKRVMWTNLDAPSLRHAIALEDHTQVMATRHPEHREAISAFLAKRPPAWP